MIARLMERDPDEHHRVATPLELFVDLASVIAIASAAAGLHHALAEGHYAEGLLVFLITFFAIWLAWLNYTWFASAFDDGSLSFKLATFVFLSGSLVMAAGVTEFTHIHLIRVMVIGYVIMRLAMVYLWFAAARGSDRQGPASGSAGDPEAPPERQTRRVEVAYSDLPASASAASAPARSVAVGASVSDRDRSSAVW